MTLTTFYTLLIVVLTPEGTSTFARSHMTSAECRAAQHSVTVESGDELVSAMCVIGGQR